MKCPECVREGKQSKVFIGTATSYAVHVPSYYDEAGRLVVGQSGGEASYRCSRGHVWTERTSPGYTS